MKYLKAPKTSFKSDGERMKHIANLEREARRLKSDISMASKMNMVKEAGTFREAHDEIVRRIALYRGMAVAS